MIKRKAALYKSFMIGYAPRLGVDVFLVEKWVDKFIDISKASDKRIVINPILANILIVYPLKTPQNLWF